MKNTHYTLSKTYEPSPDHIKNGEKILQKMLLSSSKIVDILARVFLRKCEEMTK